MFTIYSQLVFAALLNIFSVGFSIQNVLGMLFISSMLFVCKMILVDNYAFKSINVKNALLRNYLQLLQKDLLQCTCLS